VRRAPRRLPWLLIAVSSLLIVVRRLATLEEFVLEGRSLALGEVVTLVVSLLFFFGVLLMSRMFQEVAQTQAALKDSEKALRAASLYSRGLLEASLDPLVTISPDGKITDANAAAIKARGVSRERLIGSDFADYFTDPEAARAGYRRVFAEGQVTDYALALRHVSGSTRDVLYNASVYRNEADEVVGVFAAARDITKMKRAEEALKENLEALRKAMKQIRTLRGIVPICARCKKIRNDAGFWQQVEVYVHEHSEAEFTHGLCPECTVELFPDVGPEDPDDRGD